MDTVVVLGYFILRFKSWDSFHPFFCSSLPLIEPLDVRTAAACEKQIERLISCVFSALINEKVISGCLNTLDACRFMC